MRDAKQFLAKPRDTLDQPVDEGLIQDIYAAGLLDAAARDAALNSLHPSHHWWRWANRTLLFVGTALVLAGVIFFFAHNWARMHTVSKFCLIETALWICAAAAWRRGLDTISGKVLLLSASVLVGVLLAIYGQAYQTGADAYENYVLWALLILLWVIVARFAALWILWLTVTNVALILFWVQVDAPVDFDFYFGIFLLLGIWNGLALAGREFGAAHGLAWLAGDWTRHVIWFSILCYLSIPPIALIVDDFEGGHGELAGAVALAITLGGGHIYFRRIAGDVLSLGLGILALCIVLLTLIGKVLFEISDGAMAFLALGLVVLVTSSAAAFYLRHVSRIMSDDRSD